MTFELIANILSLLVLPVIGWGIRLTIQVALQKQQLERLDRQVEEQDKNHKDLTEAIQDLKQTIAVLAERMK